MNINILSIITILIILSSCTNIKYKSDKGFVLPVTGGSLESIVYIDLRPCKDMDGQLGMCSKRIYHDRNLTISIPPRNYDYNINIMCSRSINFNNNYDVVKNREFKIEIDKNIYSDVSHFTCIGSIAPMDRGIVSHKFEVRVRIIDSDYIKRNKITQYDKGKNIYLILGQYSKYVQVSLNGEWKFYKEKTVLKVKKKNIHKVKVISESESGRLTYYNM